jgi:hypothetical protein
MALERALWEGLSMEVLRHVDGWHVTLHVEYPAAARGEGMAAARARHDKAFQFLASSGWTLTPRPEGVSAERLFPTLDQALGVLAGTFEGFRDGLKIIDQLARTKGEP